MQGIGMLTKVPYIKTYTMQGYPVQGLTVPACFYILRNYKKYFKKLILWEKLVGNSKFNS